MMDGQFESILGASNCTRIIIDDPNIHNLSVSGTTLDNVQSLLDKSDNEVEADFVKKVILSLGTNDISKHKHDFRSYIPRFGTPLGVHSVHKSMIACLYFFCIIS
jgi:lysophospholipase L1-like esterase